MTQRGQVKIPPPPPPSFSSPCDLNPKPITKQSRPRSPTLSQPSNAPKRARLSQSSGKENFIIKTRASPIKSHASEAEVAERDLMEELMAGLDASVFEHLPSSPFKPPSQVKAVSPLKHDIMSMPLSPVKMRQVKREPFSPTSISYRPQSNAVSPSKATSTSSRMISTVTPPSETRPQSIHSVFDTLEKIPFKNDKPHVLDNDIPFEKDVKPEFIDDLEEIFDFDFDLADLSAFDDDILIQFPPAKVRYPILNPAVPRPPDGYRPTPWARGAVESVFEGLVFFDGKVPESDGLGPQPGAGGFGKTLVVKLGEDNAIRVVHLKERWVDIQAKKGDIVNIMSPHLDINPKTEDTSESSNNPIAPIVISFKEPSTFLIHHPDILLTMTSIANAMPCPRRPLIQALLKPSAPPSKAILYGTILHTILQVALQEQDFSLKKTRETLDKQLSKEETRLEIWGAGMEVQDVRDEVLEKAGKGFETFGEKWIRAVPTAGGELHSAGNEKSSLLAISGLHDVEEDIWSPKWGLKGKVDASVQATIISPNTVEAEEKVAPLEIKTGRSVGVLAHRAQTMLYTLLIEDRYATSVPAGLLYYSQLDSILRVEAKVNEIRALILARNELAGYLAQKRVVPYSADDHSSLARPGLLQKDLDISKARNLPAQERDVEDTPFLPATIDNPRECRTCYAVDSCMLYRKAVDQVQVNEDDAIAELYEDKTGHMSGRDVAFFKKWETLLTVEEQEITRFRSQLWTMTAKAREKTGRCFSDMIIVKYSNDAGQSFSKIHRHSYTFSRAAHAATQAHNTSLLSGHITKGDPVSLSIEPDLLCLSRGFVTDLTEHSITIAVTYVIDVTALLARTGHQHRARATGGIDHDQIVFRIDKDEMASGIQRMRSNLAQLFFKNGDEKRRSLMVDLAKPTFELARLPEDHEIPTHLNVDQKEAMKKVMTARDYALILGMPGTGKTTTIAEIIKALVERGKSVLLTSYTHSAVDTILMKLLNSDLDMLRLGNVDKVHPDVRHLTLEAYEESKTMAALESRLMRPQVVAATCLSIEHPLFFRRKFDYCIVDEASQITLPTCIGPLRLAETFVLVGDHFQLPPIVRNREAKRGGLDASLFRLLSDAHPEAVVDLSHQYRMNEDIMTLSNRLIYEGKLKCGSEEVARQALVLPAREVWEGAHAGLGDGCSATEGVCWIDDLLHESSKAIFVDTDLVPALDSKIGDLVQNETEAKLVHQFASALATAGIKQQDIAVITPYRQQIKLLTGMFGDLPKIEILTADKSQGRDKDCILISLVRSNEVGNIGDLLKDWRRINVSFTRAKKKLVIFGSRKTLKSDKLLEDFFELMEGKKWIRQLPAGADCLHDAVDGVCVKKEVGGGIVKVEDMVTREEFGVKKEMKVQRGGMGILNGRPFAEEVMGGLA